MPPLGFYGSLATAGGVFLGFLASYVVSHAAELREEHVKINREKERLETSNKQNLKRSNFLSNAGEQLDEIEEDIPESAHSQISYQYDVELSRLEANVAQETEGIKQLANRIAEWDNSRLYRTYKMVVAAGVLSVIVPVGAALPYAMGVTLSQSPILGIAEPLAVFLSWFSGLAVVIIHIHNELRRLGSDTGEKEEMRELIAEIEDRNEEASVLGDG